MGSSGNRPLTVIAIVVVVIAAVAFGWNRYKAATGVSKENTIQLTTDEMRKAMER